MKKEEIFLKELQSGAKSNDEVIEFVKGVIADAQNSSSELKEAKANTANLQKKLDDANAQIEEALEEVASLSTKLSLQENNSGENVNIVQVGKKHYKLLGNRFLVKGEDLDAKALMANEEELKRMIKIGSGSLIEVTE